MSFFLFAQEKPESHKKEIKISSIVIETGERISSLSLKKILSLKENFSYDPVSLEAKILSDSAQIHDFLIAEAYLYSRLSIEKKISFDSLLAIKFYVDGGEKILLDTFQVNSEVEFSESLKMNISSLQEDFFDEAASQQNIETIISRLLIAFESAGYSFVSAKVEELQIAGLRARLTIMLEPGSKAKITEATVTGNIETKTDVVKALAVIPYGEFYSERITEQIRLRLLKTKIFSSVEAPQPYLLPDGNIGLRISVTESNPNSIDGIIGYSEQKPGIAANLLSGIVNLELRNLFGTARKFRFHWLSDQTSSQEIYAEYTEPIVFGLPLSIGGIFSQRQQDTTFSRTNYSITTAFAFAEGIDISANIFTEKISPSAVNSNGFIVFESENFGVGGEISFDTRENFVSPQRGIFYTTGFSISEKNILGPQKFLDSLMPQRRQIRRKISLHGGNFFSLINDQVEYLHGHFLNISGEALEESELYRIGGRNTIRGYPENFFLTAQTYWIGFEHRLLLSESSYLGLFVDAGHIDTPVIATRKIPHYPDLLLGYGLTGQFETPLGLVGLTLALGKDDSFSQAKVSVGLNTAF